MRGKNSDPERRWSRRDRRQADTPGRVSQSDLTLESVMTHSIGAVGVKFQEAALCTLIITSATAATTLP